MKAQDILKATHATTNLIFSRYLSDMSDADLLVRPAPGCNHIAWQLGHLLASNSHLLDCVSPESAPKLPAGFEEKYTNETAKSDQASDFLTKAEYEAMFQKLGTAVDATIDQLSEAGLDQPSPETYRSWCPTLGNMMVLVVTHSLMHAGQWVPIRRQLHKPVVM